VQLNPRNLGSRSRRNTRRSPRYNKIRCFDPFPFPTCTEVRKQTIRDIAERLDAHRKRQHLHRWLTLTEMYNVLEKLRSLSAPVQLPVTSNTPPQTSDALARLATTSETSANGAQHTSLGRRPRLRAPNDQRAEGPTHNLAPDSASAMQTSNPAPASAPRYPTHPGTHPFTELELAIYDAGLIGILGERHDSLDRAVLDAYGWPHNISTEQILERVVALNAERRPEEASGLIRWLRPEYQAPNSVPVTSTLEGFLDEAPAARRRKQPWPVAIPDQFRASSRKPCAPPSPRPRCKSPPASALPPAPASPESSLPSPPSARPASPKAVTRSRFKSGRRGVLKNLSSAGT
jgi:hypothetical protein